MSLQTPVSLPIPEAVTSAVERIVRSMNPERVILFGSHADQTAHPASDVDLLIVIGENAQTDEELRHARQLVAPFFPPIDVAVCTAEQAAQADAGSFYFLQAALERGVVLYEKRET